MTLHPQPVAAVDEVLPAKELATFGLQHVLGMYAGAAAVPLIVGAAFKVTPSDMVWSSRGEREVAALDFITGPGTTVLRPGELLRSIRVGPEPRTALRQFSLTPIGRSAALLIGRADPFVLTITGATPRPVQIASLDEIDGLECFDDVHGSPEWRRRLVRVLAEEIVEELA